MDGPDRPAPPPQRARARSRSMRADAKSSGQQPVQDGAWGELPRAACRLAGWRAHGVRGGAPRGAAGEGQREARDASGRGGRHI
jgi:hypothetical protein